MSALRLTNASLQNSVSVQTYQTLTAVILLGSFEGSILDYFEVI